MPGAALRGRQSQVRHSVSPPRWQVTVSNIWGACALIPAEDAGSHKLTAPLNGRTLLSTAGAVVKQVTGGGPPLSGGKVPATAR